MCCQIGHRGPGFGSHYEAFGCDVSLTHKRLTCFPPSAVHNVHLITGLETGQPEEREGPNEDCELPSPLPVYTDSNLDPHERRANLSHLETSFLVSALLGYPWFHVILLQLDKSLLCNMELHNRYNEDKW